MEHNVQVEEERSFTVKITRFTRDGIPLATIELITPDNSIIKNSLCERQDLIERVYRDSLTLVSSEINNAGIADRPTSLEILRRVRLATPLHP